MAQIIFRCPTCSKCLAVDRRGAGMAFPCTDCGQPVEAPVADVAFTCPKCDLSIGAPRSLAGQQLACPECHKQVQVPDVGVGSQAPSLKRPLIDVKGEGVASPVSSRSESPVGTRTLMGLAILAVVVLVLLVLVEPVSELWLGAAKPAPSTTTTLPPEPVGPVAPVGMTNDVVEGPIDVVAPEPAAEDPGVDKPLDPAYRRLRDIYETSLKRIRAETADKTERDRRIVLLSKKYIEHLSALRERLLRVGKDEVALQVQNEVARVEGNPLVVSARFARETVVPEPPPEPEVPAEPASDPVPSSMETKPSPDALPPQPAFHDKKPPEIEGARFNAVPMQPVGTTIARNHIALDVQLSVEPVSDGAARESTGLKYSRTERETGYRLRLGVRAAQRAVVLERVAVGVQYFMAPRAGGSVKRQVPQQVAMEFVRLDSLKGTWTYVDFPPVTIKEQLIEFQTPTYRKTTTDGRTFHGLVITLFRADGTLIYQSLSSATLRSQALTKLP
jgi:hypothetical protein